MAHKYSNFASAFAQLKNTWDDMYDDFDEFNSYYALSATYKNEGDWARAITFANLATRAIRNALFHLLDGYYRETDQSYFLESMYWSAQGGETYELSFTKMLDAMLSAAPAEIDEWMAITEAFKTSVWDKPFLEITYAKLVEQFKEWG